ncbi:MAG: NYN domain-containing protein [Promethearchaeota archaeon]
MVDGSNIALFNPTRKGLGRFGNLQAFMNYFSELSKNYSIQYQILVDASLKHKIDNEKELESKINTGKIIQCPSRTDADYFILEYFKRHEDNVIIISNDNFSDYDVTNLKQCRFAFILDEIILNPPIEQFLDDSNENPIGEEVNAMF